MGFSFMVEASDKDSIQNSHVFLNGVLGVCIRAHSLASFTVMVGVPLSKPKFSLLLQLGFEVSRSELKSSANQGIIDLAGEAAVERQKYGDGGWLYSA